MSNNAVPKLERFLSGRRLGWAGLSALIGCVACCTLPLLASVGLGGGAAACLWPGAELIVVGGAFLVTLGGMTITWRMKRRQSDRADACGIGSCAPANEDRRGAEEPIACTLDHRDMQTRVDEYRAVFGRIVHAERFDRGFAWRFRWHVDVEAQVRALVAKEQECCRFFRFDVRRDGADIIWETRADARAVAVLEEFFHLPERLLQEPRRGHDVQAVTARAKRAGLVFFANAGEERT
jgi:hypothetical protein